MAGTDLIISFLGAVALLEGRTGTDLMPGVFAQIGMEYAHRYGGADLELFARIAEKNHAHSTLNPLAAYQKRFTLEQIMNDVMISYPNTRSMCSANCDGAAAAVLVTEAKLRTLSGELKKLCATGGSITDGVIEVQGDHRDKVVAHLRGAGHQVKLAGG